MTHGLQISENFPKKLHSNDTTQTTEGGFHSPRLPKVFSITHLPKGGGWLPPPMNLRLTCPKYECVVP